MLLIVKIWAATSPNLSNWLRAHFIAQFLATATLLTLNIAGFGISSVPYAMAFCLVHLITIFTASGYAIEYLLTHSARLQFIVAMECVMLPLFLAAMLADRLLRPMPYWALISMIEGICVCVLGIATITGAMLRREKQPAFTLGLLWLVCTVWLFVFSFGKVDGVNQWLPACFVIVAFGWIGLWARMRPHH